VIIAITKTNGLFVTVKYLEKAIKGKERPLSVIQLQPKTATEAAVFVDTALRVMLLCV
jgi:hypothetical protein